MIIELNKLGRRKDKQRAQSERESVTAVFGVGTQALRQAQQGPLFPPLSLADITNQFLSSPTQPGLSLRIPSTLPCK